MDPTHTTPANVAVEAVKILVIKQTSLGDVLHSTGHIRAIREYYPNSHLTLLTATTSMDIYRYNTRVDEIITIDRYRIKRNWYRQPLWAWREISGVMRKIRRQRFDLAIDLQGLAKSVLFLYGAKAERKLVKGNWWGLEGFRDKNLHAIREMDRALELAKIPTPDTSMEFCVGAKEKRAVDQLLARINPQARPLLIMSPFTRWPSKDWPLENYLATRKALAHRFHVVFTGAGERKREVDEALHVHGLTGEQTDSANLLGALTLPEFAELVRRAELMLTGDSFPLHVAGAVKTPVVALFGPTDEKKTGPLGPYDRVIRVPGCRQCDRPSCPRRCLARLDSKEALRAIESARR